MTQKTTKEPLPIVGILPNDDDRLHKVVMTNLKKDTTKEELQAWLTENTGVAESSILSIEIKEPQNKEKTTNFAEIVFNSTRSTDETIANLYKIDEKERKFKDNTMNMTRSIPDFIKNNEWMHRCKMAKSKKLFIANLPKTNQDLEGELKKHIGSLVESEETQILGTIETYQVIFDKDASGNRIENSPKGYAFIHVSSEQLADKLAIQCGGGFDIGGRRVDLKKNVDGEGRGGMRGGRGGSRGGFRGGRGGFAPPPQWGYGPPQGYGYGQGYGQEWYPPQHGYGGYGYGDGYNNGYF